MPKRQILDGEFPIDTVRCRAQSTSKEDRAHRKFCLSFKSPYTPGYSSHNGRHVTRLFKRGKGLIDTLASILNDNTRKTLHHVRRETQLRYHRKTMFTNTYSILRLNEISINIMVILEMLDFFKSLILIHNKIVCYYNHIFKCK